MRTITSKQAADLIQDGWTVCTSGFVGAGHAESISAAIEARFLESGRPRDLTLVYAAGQGDRKTRGVNHFGFAGLTRRVIGGHWRSAPRLGALAIANEIEAYNLPQGVMAHLYRAIAGGKPGVITKLGLHTFVDPRHDGAKINSRASESLVELVTLRGEEHLLYLSFPIHCALLRGTSADPNGNISGEEEAFHQDLLAIAQAARNSGGIVIVQVKRLVGEHELNPNLVRIPGILVDYVVVAERDEDHWMTFGERFNPVYTGAQRAMSASVAPRPLDVRKVIQRRAFLELAKLARPVVNLGVGMPAGVGAIAREEGFSNYTMTVEAGPIGGTPAQDLSFGASADPEAIIDHAAMFDFYDGGGLDISFLGLAEMDGQGNVNASRFGDVIAGVGGFINISQSAKRLVFMGTLTARGLEIKTGNGRLAIVREGVIKKVVQKVQHLTFNGPYTASLGISVLYVTERAVFAIHDGHLTLVEIAPGVDLLRDVLAQLATEVAVAPDLKTMDERIFRDTPMLTAAA
jgi:propionate CoA-transferase